MLDKGTLILSIFQLWILQFLLFFIDIFTKFNVDSYFPLISYVIFVNLTMLFSLIFTKIKKKYKILMFLFSILFIFLGVLGLLLENKVLNYWFWFINAGFLFLFILFNKFRKLFNFEIGQKFIISFVLILFLSQFIFLNVFYSIIVSFLFGIVYWYHRISWIIFFFGFSCGIMLLNLIFKFTENSPSYWIAIFTLGFLTLVYYLKINLPEIEKEETNEKPKNKKSKEIIIEKPLKINNNNNSNKTKNKKFTLDFKIIINILLIILVILGLLQNKYYFAGVFFILLSILFVYISKNEPYLKNNNNINKDNT